MSSKIPDSAITSLQATDLEPKSIDVDPLIKVSHGVGAVCHELANGLDRVRFEQHEDAGRGAGVVEQGAGEPNAWVQGLHHVRVELRYQGFVLGLHARFEASDA